MPAFFKNISINSQAQVKRVCLLLSATAAALLFSYSHDIPFDNPSSRYATIDSLVHQQTFNIETSPFAKFTVDKIFTPEGQLSTKSPLLPVLVAQAYSLYVKVTGRTLHNHPHQTLYILNLFFGLGCTLFLLFYAYRLLLAWTKDLKAVVAGLCVLSVGHLGFSYATTLNNHTPTAAALIAAFYYIYAFAQGHTSSRTDMIMTGLLLGLASAFDHGAALLCIGFSLYLFLLNKKLYLCIVLPASLLPLITNSLLTYAAVGTWLPIQMQPELYSTVSNYWHNGPQHLVDALEPPKWRYALHFLIGHHGIFSFSPVLCFALPPLLKRLNKNSPDFPYSLIVVCSFLGMLLYYILNTHNYGGICIGARWFILIMPILLLFSLRFLEENKNLLLEKLFWLAVAVSVYNSVQAMKAPWQLSPWFDYFLGMGWS